MIYACINLCYLFQFTHFNSFMKSLVKCFTNLLEFQQTTDTRFSLIKNIILFFSIISPQEEEKEKSKKKKNVSGSGKK